MPRRKKKAEIPPGTFRPAKPGHPQDVLRLYAIAARAVCEYPDKVEEISQTLTVATDGLVPPESVAAEECTRLWPYFVRAVTSPKPALQREAGRAIYRDLDSLSQRMDLAPLASWSNLPTALDEPNAIALDEQPKEGVSLDEVKARAKEELGENDKLAGAQVAELLGLLSREALETTFGKLVGEGVIGRGEGGMVVRWLAKGEPLTDEDEAVIETLETLGKWLTSG